MRLDQLSRWQAALVHLAISIAIVALIVAVMLLVWYPRLYFRAAGGATLLLLLIGVNVVVAPLLTLLVYNAKKKRIKLDLIVIAMLQLAALTYGTMAIFNARPVYVAFAGDRFEIVAANEIDESDLEKAVPEFRSLPLTGPKLVGAKLPVDREERERLMLGAVFGGSLGLFPQHYVPYAAVAENAIAKGQRLSELKAKHPASGVDIDAVIAASGSSDAGLRYLPLQGRHADMAAVVDTVRGDILAVMDVDPW